MDAIRKKLLYQSQHRGCKETDGVLGPFAEKFLPDCDEAELRAFAALLAENDWELWHWFTHPGSAPEQHREMVEKIAVRF